MRKDVTRNIDWLGLVLLLACPALLAQQGQPSTVTGAGRAAHSLAPGATESIPPATRDPRYRICRDDVLSVSFPLSPEVNQKVTVQPDGFISLEGAGSVHVEGLTVPGVVEAIKEAYRGTLHDPIVNVDLTDFQKPFFTVMGQVGKPGQYDLRYDITVTQAIAVAGGFEPTAKNQVFLYRAVSSNWAEVRELKLKDILTGKNVSEDVHLRPGDMIFVPENRITKFKKYVPYSVAITPPYPTVF
jgi:polysaccharide biosynthesis/export protein